MDGSNRADNFADSGGSVQAGHDLCEQLEHKVAATLTRTHVFTHLEPIEDPKAWEDQGFRWEQG